MTNSAVSFTPPRPYYYLWHLVALGVLTADFGPADGNGEFDLASPNITGTAWDAIEAAHPTASAPARIAMIDIGVSRLHPNLKNRIDTELSLDLVSHPYGSRTIVDPTPSSFAPEAKHAFFAGLTTAGLGALGMNAAENAYLSSLVADLAASQGVLRTLAEVDETFGSHGTGAAGLAVGEPAILSGSLPADPSVILSEGADTALSSNTNLLPYFGVDPFSRLVSIRTGFAQNADQFIAAFLYAWKSGVDVILLPRGIPDPVRAAVVPKPELANNLNNRRNWERADLFARLEEATTGELAPLAVGKVANRDLPWNVLAKLIVAISGQIPVVCAAGNDGESQLIYPANLAAANNGIIAVGAVTAKGYRSGYSNYGAGLTLVAPSDDGEVYTRHQMRIDRTNPMVGLHAYDPGSGAVVPHSHLSLLTTDLPGSFGYAEGSEPYSSVFPPLENPGYGGGYYTSFGGTSGAAALVAGAAALVSRAHKAKHGAAAKLNGLASKAALVAASHQQAVVLPGAGVLTPDPMNADDEPTKGRTYFFGAGLLNAGQAVAAVLTP